MKTDIVRTQHADVKIIIPGDKTAVAHCAEKSSAVGKPGDIMLSADPVDFGEHSQLRCPIPLHHGRDKETFADFVFEKRGIKFEVFQTS